MALIMAGTIHYSGNVDWLQQTNPEWSTDSWGLDEANITYSGRRDKCEAFQTAKLVDFSAMPDFPQMYLRGYNVRDHRTFPIIEAKYFGLREGNVPTVKAVDSIVVQTVTTSGKTNKGAQISGEFSYRASRTSYSWIENSNPADSSRYTSVRRKNNPINTIFSWRITDDAGKAGNVPYADFVTLLNSLKQQETVSEYEPEELVPGRLWGCKASVDNVLVGV